MWSMSWDELLSEEGTIIQETGGTGFQEVHLPINWNYQTNKSKVLQKRGSDGDKTLIK